METNRCTDLSHRPERSWVWGAGSVKTTTWPIPHPGHVGHWVNVGLWMFHRSDDDSDDKW